MTHLYQQCTRCVMDNSDSRIQFDENGVCDHCNTFDTHTLPNWHRGEAGKSKLDELISKVKVAGRNHDFDCIIGMSGGSDSSWLAYLMVKEYGLRPLIFHVDAGWNSQIAVNNIARLMDGLGIDLFTEVIDWQEMRDLQLAFFRSGVPHIDTPQDHVFFATMYAFAAKYKVKYILTGGNLSTECVRNPLEWMYFQSDVVQLRDIHRKFGNHPLRTFPTTNILWHKLYLPYIRGIRVVRPLDYGEYNKKAAMEFLQKEFGWQPYPQKHFESRFTRFYESYWLPVRFGYDVRKVQFSSLILTGQMSREEALEELKTSPHDPEQVEHELDFVAKKLEISVDELISYRDMPRKTYHDYKSQQWMYDIGRRVFRVLGIEVGGKR